MHRAIGHESRAAKITALKTNNSAYKSKNIYKPHIKDALQTTQISREIKIVRLRGVLKIHKWVTYRVAAQA